MVEEAKIPLEKTITGETLAKEFKEHSVAEFFKKNMQMLGLTGKIRTLTTIIHEYVTNSIDACEEAKILPDIEIRITEVGKDYYEILAKDNGPGLTQKTVGKALGKLLAGTKFHRLIQSRGQQGIGASGVTMLSQMTTGTTSKVITGTEKGDTFSCEVSIDVKKNEPKISNIQILPNKFRGLAVKAKFKDVRYVNSEQNPLEYLRRTSIANPHTQIIFYAPDGKKTVFERTSSQIPKKPVQVRPHPRGVTVDELITYAKYTDSRKISSFLKASFDRMGDKAVGEISKNVSFDLNKDPKKLSWEEAEEIIRLFKKIDFIAPRTDTLRPIGDQRIEKALRAIVEPEFVSVVTRRPAVYKGGFPFQVEAAVAFGGKAGRASGEERKIELMRFANRVPLLFDAGSCATTKAVQSIDWKRYGIKDVENAPLTVFINIISVFIPYTSTGKQAVSAEDEIMEELRLSIMDTARRVSRHISLVRREQEKQEKRNLFMKYASEVAIAVSELTGKKKDDVEKKLHAIVLKKLKLEEKMEKIVGPEAAKAGEAKAEGKAGEKPAAKKPAKKTPKGESK